MRAGNGKTRYYEKFRHINVKVNIFDLFDTLRQRKRLIDSFRNAVLEFVLFRGIYNI
jgi:hypothetical protein